MRKPKNLKTLLDTKALKFKEITEDYFNLDLQISDLENKLEKSKDSLESSELIKFKSEIKSDKNKLSILRLQLIAINKWFNEVGFHNAFVVWNTKFNQSYFNAIASKVSFNPSLRAVESL